jgi:hypothetical protein
MAIGVLSYRPNSLSQNDFGFSFVELPSSDFLATEDVLL